MSFKINPAKAALTAYKNGNCGIQALNSACYGVCAAFKGSPNAWAIGDECAASCEQFVQELRKDFYGSTYCDHHAPNRPVLWDQSPSFFPTNFAKYKNVPKELAVSLKQCENTTYPESCKNKAKLESYAVEEMSAPSVVASSNGGNHDGVDFSKYEKAHPVPFWIGFAVAVVLFVVFFIVLIRALKK